MDASDRIDELRRITHRVLERTDILEAFGEGEFYLRCAVLVGRVQHYFLRELEYWRLSLQREAEELIQLHDELNLDDADMRTFLEDTVEDTRWSAESRAPEEAPWRAFPMGSEYDDWPNMLHPDTMSYLYWLARTFDGIGDFVELGCWLGSGTRCLANGLIDSSRERLLHVFDSFAWSSYMGNLGRGARLKSTNLSEGDSFQHLFEEHCSDIPRNLLKVNALTLPDSREGRELIDGASIGVVVFDMSQDFELTSRLWQTFSPCFVPNSTVVVFQQYGNARAQGLRRFCRQHSSELKPLHKPQGSAKGFLFRNAPQ